jgi:glyceraldehyde-3-phosphate dehydrogenase (NAD(P))
MTPAPSRSPRHTRIGLVGLGTIGKRLADAVLRIPDFQLVGVCVRRSTPAIVPIVQAGVPIYVSDRSAASLDGPPFSGELRDLLLRCDIVLDCTPRGTGASLHPTYAKAAVRSIFQGGEASGLAGSTYCAGIGFDRARSATSVRVSSCNTTGLTRLAQCLDRIGPIRCIRACLTRSAADPDKFVKGMPNALIASAGESHHGIEIREIWPGLDIRTLASYAPVNCGHLVSLFAKMRDPLGAEDVLRELAAEPRVCVVNGGGSLSDLRSVGAANPRQDCPAVIVWREGVQVSGGEIVLSAGIHMESIVIPETLDVLFAMTGLECERQNARQRTDAVLNLGQRIGRSVRCT